MTDMIDTQILVKDICIFNIVKYSKVERSIISMSQPIIGVIRNDDKCYDFINDDIYPILSNINLKNKNYENSLYASILEFPFKNMDEVIDWEYMHDELINKKRTINNLKLFDENKICRFKYKLNKEKVTSIGYISSSVDGNVYDLANKQIIENEKIYYRNIPFNNSDNIISMEDINNILKLRKNKTHNHK